MKDAEGEGAVQSIDLADVGVLYRVPSERILSFKEFVLRWMRRQITYRKLWALDGVTLQIGKGEVFGIVGRNGAGKSTLLKVISRVLHPTRGRIVVRGQVAPLLELGAGFHPDLTGRENVILNGTILGLGKAQIRRHMAELVEFAELQDFIDAPIRTYSSGMTARLGFSVATQFRPDILLLDEVLAVGDVGFQEKCYQRIRSFREQGTTIVLVSHSLEAVREQCQRVAWLEQGRIVALGPSEEVVTSYGAAMAAQ